MLWGRFITQQLNRHHISGAAIAEYPDATSLCYVRYHAATMATIADKPTSKIYARIHAFEYAGLFTITCLNKRRLLEACSLWLC
jgi:hypothetical protein